MQYHAVSALKYLRSSAHVALFYIRPAWFRILPSVGNLRPPLWILWPFFVPSGSVTDRVLDRPVKSIWLKFCVWYTAYITRTLTKYVLCCQAPYVRAFRVVLHQLSVRIQGLPLDQRRTGFRMAPISRSER